MIVFPSIYWFGWIVQPTLNGYFVYDRQDHASQSRERFTTMSGAMNYIRSRV